MSLHAVLLHAIRRDGPMTFARFMERALYEPELGYYAAGPERSGWSGDFVTSPEIDPAFGALWAAAFEQIWRACGAPARFDVVEIGPGEGAFAAAVLASATGDFGDALSYHLVEPLLALEARQRTLLRGWPATWSRSLAERAEGAACGCVFANEVLDNLPLHLVERRAGELVELWVDADRDALVLVPGPPSSGELEAYLGRAGMDLAEGSRTEVGLAAEAVLQEAAAAVARGAVVAVDYGLEAGELGERPAGTLVTSGDALGRPGLCDITAHVNWSAARAALRSAGATPVGPLAQRDVLSRLGLRDLDARLGAQQRRAATTGDGAALVRTLSRRQALGVLAEPGGLGGLGVLVGMKAIAPPPFLIHSEEDRPQPVLP